MKKRQKRSNALNAKLAIDCQDNTFLIMLSVFSAAYLPACNAIESLMNLPMTNQGIINLAFIFIGDGCLQVRVLLIKSSKIHPLLFLKL